MKMARLAVLAFFISISGTFALDWVGSQTHAGIAYFFVSSPARVDRYPLRDGGKIATGKYQDATSVLVLFIEPEANFP
jgi:hypothetical protein